MSKDSRTREAQRFDIRWVSLAVIVVVAYPILMPIGLPLAISPNSRAVYAAIDAVPAGGYVLVDVALEYGGRGEMLPMEVAVLKHLFSRDVKVILVGFFEPVNALLAQEGLNDVKPENYGKIYGKDYINLGLLSGGELSQQAFAADPHKLVTVDYQRTPISQYTILDNLHSAKDLSLVVFFTMGYDVPLSDLRQFQATYNVKVTGGCSGILYSGLIPYVQSGQITGLLASQRGAAEYELLVGKPGSAILSMDAQSLLHIALFIFILLANIFYVILPKVKGGNQ